MVYRSGEMADGQKLHSIPGVVPDRGIGYGVRSGRR